MTTKKEKVPAKKAETLADYVAEIEEQMELEELEETIERLKVVRRRLREAAE